VNGRGRTVAGAIGLALLIGAAILADLLALHPPAAQHAGYVYAPPMLPRIVDDAGRWRWPFVYPLRLEDRLERRFAEDRGRPMPLRFRGGRPIVSTAASTDPPWFPLGTDALGRDVWSRLVLGARVSLAVAFAAAAVALLLGSAAGALAGYLGGAADDLLMWAADVMIALPAIYVVLALRAAAPLVLAPWQIFWIMVGVFALAGWPPAARAVRSVIAAERTREYAEAARSIGAGTARLLLRHLLPAARGVLTVQAALLLPAFVLAEATLSFVGLGFGEPISSWGLMLQDAGRGGAVADAPWLLAPAVAIALLLLSINLVAPDATSAGTPVPLQRNSR
jgi:peptide/nickel transport system permease protein